MKTILTMTGIIFGHLLLSQECNRIIWSDEFDGTSLDNTKWVRDIGNGCPNLCGWGNNELQYYSDESNGNISVADGRLVITAKSDNIGGASYSSAKIITRGLASFKYGRIEARIKMPETQGIWPAFWMLPVDNKYGEWPRSGEIDIVELVGDEPNRALGTLHTGLPYAYSSGHYDLPEGQKFSDSFHVFAIDWNQDSIQWFVDDIKYHSVSSAEFGPWSPFNEEFYLIFNVAVGGNLPGNPDNTTVLPQHLEVDYVRVYNDFSSLGINGEIPFAAQKEVTYSTFALDSATYNWSVPEGATITSGQGTNQITVNWGCTAGDVIVDVKTDCDSTTLVYAINDFASFEISGLSTVVLGTKGESYSVPFVEGATYNWTAPGDAEISSGQGTNEVTVDFGQVQGDLQVEVTTDCGATVYLLPIILRDGSLLCDFEEVDLPWNVFGGATIAKVSNPYKSDANSSNFVGQTNKNAGAETWGGLYADIGTELDLENQPYMHMQVYTSRAGIVNFKLEDVTSGKTPVEIQIEQNVTNQWVDMVWDFSTEASGIFDRLALFFDFNQTNQNAWFFDNIMTSTKSTTSVFNLNLKSVNIYPNPVLKHLTLELEDGFARGDYELSIYDVNGRKLIQKVITQVNKTIDIDVNDLNEGMYFLQLSGNDIIYVRDFMKVD